MSRKKSRTPDAQAAQATPAPQAASAESTATLEVATADVGAVTAPDDDLDAATPATAAADATDAAAADEPFAIDDVATLLVQLEVADTAELERVRSHLMRLARETDDLDAAFALGGAATQIAAAAAGEDQEHRAASLARANRLLEDAMARLDAQAAIGSASTARPSPAMAERSTADAVAGQVAVGPIDDADLMAAMAEDPAWADVAEELAAEELVVQAVAMRRSGAWPVVAGPAMEADSGASRASGIDLPDDIDMDLLRDFIAESRDWIDGAEAALLALEHDPDDEESINTVFRAFHTIKGTAGFMGLSGISEFAHHAESLLSRVRDREIAFEGDCADLSLRATDMLATMLQSVEDALAGGPLELPEEHDALMRALIALEQGDHTGSQSALAAGPASGGSATNGPAAVGAAGAGVAAGAGAPPELHDAAATLAAQHRNAAADAALAPVVPPAAAAAADHPPVERRQGDRRQGERRQGDRRQDAAVAAADRSVRVRTDRLDRLIDMVGELVIAQSMISQDPSLQRGRDQALAVKVTHAGKLVRDLQDLTMSMRMVPLKPTVQKLARLVRDLAHKAGKQVEFVTEGEDTEIDRNMVDVVGDPLVHMVRNAIDHGLETPAERLAAGKSATGTLRLRAYHAGANVCVDLVDDGRGLNRTKILAKARDRGLVSNDKHLSDSEVFDLIFAPGFSTADQVTDLSGRGVGMDVVKRNVESLRGRIDIASEAGKGSNFSIRLPLTLAITDGMLVRVGRERYIVPTTAIHMSFRPERSALSTINGRGEVVLLRDELMPIVRVHRQFDVDGAVADPAEGILMIVGDQDKRTALLVDELLGQHQLVVKSLGGHLGAIPGISGAAILGDGRVGLILDVVGLVAAARARATDGDAVRSAA